MGLALPLPLTWPRCVITHSIFSLAQRGELLRVRVRVRAQGYRVRGRVRGTGRLKRGLALPLPYLVRVRVSPAPTPTGLLSGDEQRRTSIPSATWLG